MTLRVAGLEVHGTFVLQQLGNLTSHSSRDGGDRVIEPGGVGPMAEPLTHVPEDDAVSDTDTVAPAFQAPSGAATRGGSAFLLLGKSYLEPHRMASLPR